MAVSFVLLAVDVTVESAGDLTGGQHPATSWVGIGLSAVALVAMPPLALAKWRVGHALSSSATISESRQPMRCAYLSAALWSVCWRTPSPTGGGRTRSSRWGRGGRLRRGSGRLARRELRLLLARYELAG
jgi:hypothetical protein